MDTSGLNLQDPNRDSYSPLLLSLELHYCYTLVIDLGDEIWEEVVEGWYRLPPERYFQSLTVDIKAPGAWTGTLNLFDRYNELLVSYYLIPRWTRIRLRWNWDFGPSSLDETIFDNSTTPPTEVVNCPLYQGTVMNVALTYTPEGVGLQLDLSCTSILDQKDDDDTGVVDVDDDAPGVPIDLTTEPRYFTDMTAAEIASAIASAHGWSICVEGAEGATSYETQTLGHLACAANETHMAFLANQVLPKAINRYGDRYLCWLEGPDENGASTLHFHSRAYDGCVNGRPLVAKTYIVYKDLSGEVISYKPSDQSLQQFILGGGAATFGSVDSDSGEATEETSDAGEGVEGLGGGSHLLVSEAYVPVYSVVDYDSVYVPIIERNRYVAQLKARQFHDHARSCNLIATLEVVGTHAVRPSDLVEVLYFDGTGVDHAQYLSGVFWVGPIGQDTTAIQHTVGSDGWKTTINLLRQGYVEIPSLGDRVVEVTGRPVVGVGGLNNE